MPLSEIDWNALALSAADLTGIVAFALAGILASVGRKLDPVGVYVMAFTTAFGGGIVRDVMIDNRPFYWLDKTGFMWVHGDLCPQHHPAFSAALSELRLHLA